MVVAGLPRRLILFGMAVITVLSLLFGTAVRPAQSQEEPTQVIANTLVDIDQAAQCTAAGCRNVTFDARVVFNAEESIALTEEQAAAAQEELDNALFEITVTDASTGNTREVEDGETVCLKPGRYSVTTVLVNEGAVVSAVAAVLNGLGVPVDANDIVITNFSDSFVVEACEVANRPEGGDRNHRGGAGGGAGGGGLGLGVGDVFDCSQVQAAAAAQGQYGDATAGDLGSAAAIAQELGISQEQVNACIEGVAAGEDIVIGGQYGTATAAAGGTAVSGGTAAAEEAVLPETSGASLIALGVGALLVAGGLLARRIVR